MGIREKRVNNIYTSIKEAKKRNKKRLRTCLPSNVPHSKAQAHHNVKENVVQFNNEESLGSKRRITFMGILFIVKLWIKYSYK